MININDYKAWFFDCDNTLAYTMKAHCETYKYVFNHYGLNLTDEEFYEFAPAGGKNLIKHTVIDKGYDIDPQLIINLKSELIDKFLDKYMVANTDLLDIIKNKKDKIVVVVSNGRRHSIETILNKLQILDYVDYLITAEDVKLSKPNPDPYLKALELSKIEPNKCLVFEDNEVGFQAAKSAGLTYKKVEYKGGKWN